MKALVVEKAADRSLQDLNFAEVSVPTPAEHEVLIKVHAAGLNVLRKTSTILMIADVQASNVSCPPIGYSV